MKKLIIHFLLLTCCLSSIAQTDNVQRKKQSARQNNSSVTTNNPNQSNGSVRRNNTTIHTSRSNRAVQSGKSSGHTKSSHASYSNGNLIVNGIVYEMEKVQAGTFIMGTPSESSFYKGKPAHQVTLTNNYYIGKTEITEAIWAAVMGNNSNLREREKLPVVNVSWNDCQEFIEKLNALTRCTFRLPTEAEWEYAARGGNKSKHYQLFSGSNIPEEVAWYFADSNSKTHNVASKKPNELGLYDMSGNVWEWCNDWYGDYSDEPVINPVGPLSGSGRVLRGGSWISNAESCHSSYRNDFTPGSRHNFIGFRLVLSE